MKSFRIYIKNRKAENDKKTGGKKQETIKSSGIRSEKPIDKQIKKI